MSTPPPPADDPRVLEARAHAARHRIADAERVYRDILATSPDTPEALNFIAMCALARGELADAQRQLERAAELNPAEPEIWKNVGIVWLAQHDAPGALHAFDHALELEPAHLVARLYRGAALEALGRGHDAAIAYFGALTAAQARGQWRDDDTTPPGLRRLVKQAVQFVAAENRQTFMGWLQPLRDRYGAASMVRIERGLEIYLGNRPANYPDPRQYCKFFYVPGLRTTPYYERELFPWHAGLEQHTDDIRAELRAVLAHPAGVQPFLGTNDNALLKEQKLLDGTRGPAEWNSFFFHRHGELFEQNSSRCPRTTAVLATLPLVHIRGHAPEVLFSILTPGSHILKHHGVTNTRLVTHLPLIIPQDCAISVGGIEHAWQEGHCVTFDDTFEHEAWNRSASVRAVMILDSWHPDLTPAEREAVTLLVGGIGDFNAAAKSGQGREPASSGSPSAARSGSISAP
ncbi:MAG TPA: aspartyl/asparaginyl beta-hydroxylase domain-containing protein [Rhodanobacteraceae bacterium]|nr:aspartyl/asparaginyl beta-hydroxylase domain-containing protein [Rhodanobacteraceae bacterium]